MTVLITGNLKIWTGIITINGLILNYNFTGTDAAVFFGDKDVQNYFSILNWFS